MSGRRFTEQQRLWIVAGAAIVGGVVASALFEATDRSVWPFLLVAPAIAWTIARVTDR